jgi:hypothetical protein
MIGLDFTKVSYLAWDQSKLIRNIRKNRDLPKYLIESHILIFIFTLIYGAVLGVYIRGPQIILNSVKIPILFFITFYISVPIMFIVDAMLDNKIKFPQMITMVSLGFSSTAIVLGAFTPLMLFFILTTQDYFFIVILNISICSFAGYFGILSMLTTFKKFHKNTNWFPSLLIGSFIIIFVGTQLAWTLRPFFHSASVFTRPISGNFYVAVARVIEQEPVIALILIAVFGFVGAIVTISRLFINEDPVKSSKLDKKQEQVKKQKQRKESLYANYPQCYYPTGLWAMPQPESQKKDLE